jgi:uncharacterized protein
MGVPRFWREQPYRYNLEGTRCGNCERVYYPPRGVCADCRRDSIGKMGRHRLTGTGTVVVATTVNQAAPGYEDFVPYSLAIIELDEGPRVTTHITDCDPSEIAPGTRVTKVFRRIQQDGKAGAIHYGTKFIPVMRG